MRHQRRPYKWQRQRAEAKARLERVKRLKAEVARCHSLIGRIDPQDSHKEINKLRGRIRTLEQQIRYINCDPV